MLINEYYTIFFPKDFPRLFFFFLIFIIGKIVIEDPFKKNQTNLKETLKWKTYADTQPNSLHNIRKQKESFATLQNWGCQNSLKIISLGWNKNFHRTVRNPENEPKWSEIWNILKCPNNESKHFLGYADWPIQTCNEANKSSLKESWRISEKSEEKKNKKQNNNDVWNAQRIPYGMTVLCYNPDRLATYNN